jgi:hypothetical protein
VHATTDVNGRFSLDGLDAGLHFIAVVREGYVLPGQPNIAGYPYSVDANERVTNVVLHLVPSGTIAGRVFKADGMPAARVEVQLVQRVYLMGRPQWSLAERSGSSRTVPVWTNDRGEFRVIGVVPASTGCD